MASEVTMTIQLGNAAMQTMSDVAGALDELAAELRKRCSGCSLTDDTEDEDADDDGSEDDEDDDDTSVELRIRDVNGNKVGWLVIK